MKTLFFVVVVQGETTTYFVVWWVLFEYSSFHHFPYANLIGKLTRNL